ncbi:hypothetical protein ACPCT9_23625 [Streptomyces koyangensis]|uniref:hypothetical protein n=1 Tax=Streptomyces koyangensis TaxID=188770 RepID=UPI00338B06B0
MPGTPELPALRRLLVDSLIALAADAPAQATWARRHGVPTDEFALDFDHALRTAGSRLAEAAGSTPTTETLRRLDALLRAMSGPDQADRWSRVRVNDWPSATASTISRERRRRSCWVMSG